MFHAARLLPWRTVRRTWNLGHAIGLRLDPRWLICGLARRRNVSTALLSRHGARVALVRALVVKPKLLLLDEPFRPERTTAGRMRDVLAAPKLPRSGRDTIWSP
jgi:ABC-type nitrate/sulfonate/bicarbonate transport system ATPase subunit